MLEWLHLKNFQIYVDALLEFSPGINFIKGETNNGKSSIIRALRLLALNDPLTTEYMHEGKTTLIKGCLDGVEVSKIRSKSRNEYKVGNGPPLKAFKSGVPTEVTNLLNLKPQNFQEQKEPYFLIQNTPTERTKILDNIAGFEDIENVLSNANKEVLRISGNITNIKEQISEHIETLKGYKGVEQEYERAEEAAKLIKRIKKYQSDREEINSILERLKTKKEKQKKLEKITKKKLQLQNIKQKLDECKQLAKDRKDLELKGNKLGSLNKQISKLNLVIEKKDTVQIAKQQLLIIKEIEKDKVLLNKLIKLDDRLNNANEKLLGLKEKKKSLEKKVKTCPICKKPF